MKRVLPAGLALVFAVMSGAGATSITVDAAAQRAGGVVVQVLAPVRFTPFRSTYGIVVDPSPLIALRGRIVAARIARRLSAQSLARARALYGAGHNIAIAALQAAQASEATAQAAQSALLAQARIAWGPVLGAALASGAPVITDLAEGRTSLVEADITGAAFIPAATEAATTGQGGAAIGLRLLGRAGRLPAGPIGQGFYFAGPANLAVGMPVSLRLATGPARDGVAVPAGAIVYRGGTRFVFIETKPGRFAMVAIAGVAAMRRSGRFFVGAGLRPGQSVVSGGAGVLLSAMPSR